MYQRNIAVNQVLKYSFAVITADVMLSAAVGYRLTIVKNPTCVVENIMKIIKSHVPQVQLESDVGAELSFALPKEQSAKFENLFSDLERNQEKLGIGSFGVSAPSLEEVFLK